jgi:hypothetical protein
MAGLVVWLWLIAEEPFALLLLLPLAYLGYKLFIRKRAVVSQISRELLLLDFPGEALTQKTLYQIAEIYSRRYNIPSLVDTIYHWDRILRTAVLVLSVILTIIYPVKFWQYLLAVLVSFFLLSGMIQRTALYRRLA